MHNSRGCNNKRIYLLTMYFGDWIYLFFLVPSIISFLCSSAVVFTIFQNSTLLRKNFHCLTFLVAIFDLIQSASWFPGSRYTDDDILCRVQEYMLQIGALLKTVTAVIICKTIYHVIHSGMILNLQNYRVAILYISATVCIIISISLNTAAIMCPFDRSGLKYTNLFSEDGSSHDFTSLLGYIFCFFCPLILSLMFTSYYAIYSSSHARKIAIDSITTVATSLRWYPIVIAVMMLPLSTYLFIVICTGREIRILGLIGAMCSCCSGIVNGVVYILIINKREHASSTTTYSLINGIIADDNLANINFDSGSHINECLIVQEGNGSPWGNVVDEDYGTGSESDAIYTAGGGGPPSKSQQSFHSISSLLGRTSDFAPN